MKTVIVGAGIIGLTTAWYLVKEGREVVIVEQLTGPALGTSFANGGMLSVGHSAPNVKPGIVAMALKNLFKSDAFLHFRPDFSFYQIQWLLKSLGEATATKFSLNQKRMIAIATLSRYALREIEEETGIGYEKRQGGIMQLCQNNAQMAAAKQQQAGLAHVNVASELLNKAEVLAVEPGLAYSANPIIGGIRLTDEATGDCAIFARQLAEKLKVLGVTFHYATKVTGFVTEKQEIKALETDQGAISGANFVFACGARTHGLLKPLIKVPIYPVKGYSLTLPVIDERRAPKYSVFDIGQNVAITRFDNTIRIAGYGGIEGFDRVLKMKQIMPIANNFHKWFPQATDPTNLNAWVGFRPMTPDGTPIISKTVYKNLFVNSGHGTFGWTMSAGSAKLLIEIITGKPTSLPTAHYSLARY